MPSTDFVERLSDWASTTQRRRFWTVATAGTDTLAVLLPTTSPDFVVLLIEEDGRVLAQATETTTGTSVNTLAGLVEEDPAQVLGTVAVWLRESAADPHFPAPVRREFAFSAALLASEIGDSDTQRESARLAEHLSD